MSKRIITKGLRTGTGMGGVGFILMRGLVADSNPPDPSEGRLIVIAIINKLKTISMSRGFFTDVGDCVLDWQFTNIPTDDLPCIEVKDPSEDSEIRGTFDYRVLDIEIIGKLIVTNMNDARNFQQDIESAMKDGGGPTYPDCVYLSRLTSRPEITPDQKNKKAVRIELNYEIKYRIKAF